MLSKEERETIRMAGASWVGDLTLTALLESIEELEEKLREAEAARKIDVAHLARYSVRLAKAEKLAEAVCGFDKRGPVLSSRIWQEEVLVALSDFEGEKEGRDSE